MPQHICGGEFHVGDCRVWAEIFYLDSPTDYREYLPGNTSEAFLSELQTGDSELQMLGELPSPLTALLRTTMSRVVSILLRVTLGRSKSIRKLLGHTPLVLIRS